MSASIPGFGFDELAAAAHHGERVLGRRLARRTGVPERQALTLVLEQAACVAGLAGLAGLLAARAQARLADAERLAAKTLRQEEQLALRQARRLPPATAWLAWFDGSAHPNPGRIGIGALLTGPAGQRIDISRRAGHGNSGEAEYSALLAVLEAAMRERPAELMVYGDSRVVLDEVNRVTPGSLALAVQRDDALALIAQFERITLEWIPRHRNAAADRLSQQAIGLWDAADDALT